MKKIDFQEVFNSAVIITIHGQLGSTKAGPDGLHSSKLIACLSSEFVKDFSEHLRDKPLLEELLTGADVADDMNIELPHLHGEKVEAIRAKLKETRKKLTLRRDSGNEYESKGKKLKRQAEIHINLLFVEAYKAISANHMQEAIWELIQLRFEEFCEGYTDHTDEQKFLEDKALVSQLLEHMEANYEIITSRIVENIIAPLNLGEIDEQTSIDQLQEMIQKIVREVEDRP